MIKGRAEQSVSFFMVVIFRGFIVASYFDKIVRMYADNYLDKIITWYYEEHGIPEEKQYVPAMVIGDRYLFGGEEIMPH